MDRQHIPPQSSSPSSSLSAPRNQKVQTNLPHHSSPVDETAAHRPSQRERSRPDFVNQLIALRRISESQSSVGRGQDNPNLPSLPPLSTQLQAVHPPVHADQLPPHSYLSSLHSQQQRTRALPPAICIPSGHAFDYSLHHGEPSGPFDLSTHARPHSGGSLHRLSPASHPTSHSASSHSASPYTPGLAPSRPHHLAPHHPPIPSSSVSSQGFDDRALRSPHPPLTALYSGRNPWPPTAPGHDYPAPSGPSSSSVPYDFTPGRPYPTSPLNDLPSGHPRPFTYSYNNNHAVPTHSPHSYSLAHSQGYLSAPPLLPPPHVTSGQGRLHSPLVIPPPLHFKYSASPPSQSAFLAPEMPPRKKALGSATATTVTSTTQSVSSARSSRAARTSRAAAVAGVKGNGWTTEHTYDSIGQPKEIIVIQDSASPLPKKRTRAAVAAETAKWNGSANGSVGNGTAAVVAAAAKKRKAEEEADVIIKKGKAKASNASSSIHAAAAAAAAAPPALAHAVPPGAPPQPVWDDAEGHYIVKPDDVIGGRYKIVRLLGQGTFGKVVEARHIESRRRVAIKVIRAVQKYRDASKIEIRVLETLKKNDPNNAHKCIHLTEYFDFRNHPCLVSELYGMSVFDFLKLNQFQPFPEKHIQDFAKSLLQSVQFLHSLKLVHTDLKPENILLVSNDARLSGPRRANAKSKSILRNTDIRLIDFGSATFESEYHSSVVSTRHYRAPEIILGMPWSYPCDMFSIGCILVEFFTGDALFQTHDNLEHLAMMEVVMGKMPPRMAERGRLKKPDFFKGNKVDFPNPSVSKSSRKFVKGLKPLKDIIVAGNGSANALFLDLIVRLLDFDPDSRIAVHDALKHPYLRANIPEPPI